MLQTRLQLTNVDCRVFDVCSMCVRWLLQLTEGFQAVQVELALDVLSWSGLVVID